MESDAIARSIAADAPDAALDDGIIADDAAAEAAKYDALDAALDGEMATDDALGDRANVLGGDPAANSNVVHRSPLMVGVDWSRLPPSTLFAHGAGALLVRVAPLAKLLASVHPCTDIDSALNLGTASGMTNMAALATPVFRQNFTLAKTTTIS